MSEVQINMLVARNIKALMEQRDLDAAKLAREAGLNHTGVYDILKGKSRSPKIETIAKIAAALGVPIAVIFAEQDSDARDELREIFANLSPEHRALLLQAAKAWAADPAA